MAIPALSSFNLAGGTALALQIGHRVSVDLDFFGLQNSSHREILSLLSDISKPTILTQSKSILILNIDGVKVDFVNYQYPLLQAITVVDGVRLVSLPDIAAMKLAAIAGRGKKRDFYDLYFLLQQYGLAELIQFYNDKYLDGSEFMILKSLIYFEDANEDESLQMIRNVDWIEVKAFISREVDFLYK